MPDPAPDALLLQAQLDSARATIRRRQRTIGSLYAALEAAEDLLRQFNADDALDVIERALADGRKQRHGL